VTVNVSGVNDAPVTANQTFVESEDGTVSGSLADSTTDVDDAGLAYQVVADASKPKFKLGTDGSFEIDLKALGYDRLDDGESDTLSFDYLASDGEADSNVSTVTITVIGANDAPATNPDFNAASEDGPAATGNLLDNDDDADANDEMFIVDGPIHTLLYGTLQLGPQGHYSYAVTDQGLAAGDEFTDVFQYTVSDNTVSVSESLGIVVTGANDIPIAGDDTLPGPLGSTGPVAIAAAGLLANDHDVDRGTVLEVASVSVMSDLGAVVTLSGGEITYDASGVAILDTVPSGGVMADWFEYTVSDGDGGFDTARVDLSVSGRMTVANNAPLAGHESFSTNAMYAADGSIIPMEIPIALLLRNDFDPDGDPLTISGIAHSSGGSFEVVGDHILFTPTPSTGIGPVPTTLAESEPNDDFPVADFIPRIWFGPDGGGMARASYTGVGGGPDLVQFELRAGETLTIRLEETADFAFLGLTDHDNQFIAFTDGSDIVYTATRDGVHGAIVDGGGAYEISLSFNPVERAQHASFVYELADGRGGESFGSVSLAPVFTAPGQPLQAFSPLFNEWLLGGDLSDVLSTSNGDDTMTGGGGSDRFEHWSTDGRDIVTDFTPGLGGDRLAVLGTTFGSSSSNVADFVRVEESGSFFGPGSVVSVDHDGAGPAFYEQAFFLEGVTGLSASDLYASGNLVFA
jgi:VCBS repeat-containing protein